MAPISVTLERANPPTGIVTLLGEQDAYSAPRLENELALLLDEELTVVVDLSDTTFVDSQTLSILLAARHRAQRSRIGFTVVLPSEPYTQVHRILDITGLGTSFAVYPTLRAALAGARAGRNAGERARAA
jgi:anti-sigma B factor antagonist